MARSGQGTIGKVALVDQDVEGCFADFVIRMKADDQRLRPAFLRYALTSAYYQKLIYGEKKGLGNNTNIFPSQLHALPWLSADPEMQDEVVTTISQQEQSLIAKAIEAKSLFEQTESTLMAEV